MVKTPGEVFSFMQSNKIGEKIALFWIAWAFVAEKFDNFKLADQIFQKAIRRQAEPKDVLQKRYQQFQRRMARHFLNKMEEGGQVDEVARPALQTVGSQPTQANADRGLGNQRSVQTLPPTQSIRSKSKSVQPASNNNGVAGFTLFVEENATVIDEEPAQLTENKAWKTLGKDSERRKENEGKDNLLAIVTVFVCIRLCCCRISSS